MDDQVRSTIQKRDDKGRIRHGAEWLAIWSDPESVKTDDEKKLDANRLKYVETIRRRLAASTRSIAEEPALEVVFSGRETGPNRIVLTDLDPSAPDLPAARGESDKRASILRHHDRNLHARLRPKDPDEAVLFDLAEEARCIGLAGRRYPGIAANQIAHHTARLKKSDLYKAHLAVLIPLSEALRMVLRDSFLSIDDPSIPSTGFRMWDRWLRERHQQDFDRLSDVLEDQGEFAASALSFLERLFVELPSKGRTDRQLSPSAKSGDAADAEIRRESDDMVDGAKIYEPGEQILDIEDAAEEKLLTASRAPIAAPYRVFTTEHDRIVYADDLADRSELRSIRHELDARRAEFRRSFAKLVSRLQRRLMALQTRSWEFDLDDGLIDASRLDRVVVNPGFSHAYKQEIDSPFRDTVVTLLVDNSGSMRGKPIEIACLVADMLAAALERCGVSVEVLGFTTSGWKGGKSGRDWAKSGKPDNPGRLNDLLHIIYKSADTPLRRARDAMCAMLSPSVLKENVDGEALAWAARRLSQRQEARKVLVVISDGAPVDEATIEANSDRDILDRHLRQVIAKIEGDGLIELSAIGIKHDVGSYYRRAARIDRAEDLGATLVAHLDGLFLNAGGR